MAPQTFTSTVTTDLPAGVSAAAAFSYVANLGKNAGAWAVPAGATVISCGQEVGNGLEGGAVFKIYISSLESRTRGVGSSKYAVTEAVQKIVTIEVVDVIPQQFVKFSNTIAYPASSNRRAPTQVGGDGSNILAFRFEDGSEKATITSECEEDFDREQAEQATAKMLITPCLAMCCCCCWPLFLCPNKWPDICFCIKGCLPSNEKIQQILNERAYDNVNRVKFGIQREYDPAGMSVVQPMAIERDGAADPLAQIAKLQGLLNSGAITRKEFEDKKAGLLAQV